MAFEGRKHGNKISTIWKETQTVFLRNSNSAGIVMNSNFCKMNSQWWRKMNLNITLKSKYHLSNIIIFETTE